MLIDGKKFACDSCVKGHRVSNCNHRERPLNPIAPKGRPVKQCDHCRDARKSKSHHAKCDCGSKRAKDKKSEPISEDRGCCCHEGTQCVCSNKAVPSDLRLETSLSRSVSHAKAKPKLTSSTSDTTLETFAGGHHKPLHRHNNLAHTSGAPYKIPRPHTLHGASAFADATRGDSDVTAQRTVDDLLLLSSGSKLYNTGGAQLSAEDLRLSAQPPSFTSFDVDNLLGNASGSSGSPFEEDLIRTTSAELLATSVPWFDNPLPAVAEGVEELVSIPSTSDWEWNNIPSATTEFFSPSDLPLVPDAGRFADYAQPISHSGESNYQSVPGLTACSSGAQSEVAFPTGSSRAVNGLPGYWDDNLVFRPQSYDSQAEANGGFGYGAADLEQVNKSRASPLDDFSFTGAPSSHTHSLSDSTTVLDLPAVEEVNAGHLANMASLSSSQTLTNSYDANDVDIVDAPNPGSIIIPVGSDDPNDGYWSFRADTPASGAEQPSQYAWLQ